MPFNNLPYEIQSEILKSLHWRDLLRVRQVSRSLFSASKDREVLAAIANNHILEKRISAHSNVELEEAILRSGKVDVAWSKRSSLSHRIVKIHRGDHLEALLPGGRWALATRDGSSDLICYDLDSTPPRHFVLVPTPAASYPYPPKIDVDFESYQEPYLTFNMATFHAHSAASSLAQGRLQVLRVEPKFDDDGYIVKLSSTVLSVFEPRLRAHSLRLNGPYITYLAESFNSSWIVDWKLADGARTLFERRNIPSSFDGLYTLPYDYVMSRQLSDVRLFDIKAIPLSSQGAPNLNISDPPRACPLWTEGALYRHSTRMIVHHTDKGTVYLEDDYPGFRGFTITIPPTTNGDRPQPPPPPVVKTYCMDHTLIRDRPRAHCRTRNSNGKFVELRANPGPHYNNEDEDEDAWLGPPTIAHARLCLSPHSHVGSGGRPPDEVSYIQTPHVLEVPGGYGPFCPLALDGLSGRTVVSSPEKNVWVVYSPSNPSLSRPEIHAASPPIDKNVSDSARPVKSPRFWERFPIWSWLRCGGC